MNLEAKKKVLRSFTYGLYVLTAKDGDEVAAGTVNWVTQASFQPPLVAVGLKRDSHLHALVERTGKLALMTLAHDQKAIYKVLLNEVVPCYYNNRNKWIEMMKQSILSTKDQFAVKRMLEEYYEKLYITKQ